VPAWMRLPGWGWGWVFFLSVVILTGAACGGESTGSGGGGQAGSGQGGSGGAGGGGSATFNGCTQGAAADHTADATTTISNAGLSYTPKCIRIKAGASVVFQTDFVAHPLVGGEVAGGMKVEEASSPIQKTTSGAEATFVFPTGGTFGYYCDSHALGGMAGAIYVE
jgi:plastocyanin